MTTDAKVGLLLSFVFIIIIAFLINGLPDFLESASQERLSTAVGALNSAKPDLHNQAEAVVKAINSIEPVPQQHNIQQPDNVPTEIRFRRQLPAKIASTARTKPYLAPKTTKNFPSTYVVQSGDNLAVIAMKAYGPEAGNKRAVVNKIFQANSAILESANKISVGQELTIPPLTPGKDSQKVIAAASIIGKVKNFAGRNLTALKNAVGVHRQYSVQSGDSLWQIAERFLGDGSRYHEIVELNSDIIANLEEIPVGVSLRLPTH
ncbi:MAG: LysM peptidoglycan-binding domain-containing protein [Planctomycetota bacterium]|jgi:nucleoid-associated protein YgaU